MLKILRQSGFITVFLMSAILFISVQPTVNAAIVGTADLLAEEQSYVDRAQLIKSLDRKEVQAALVNNGVDIKMAKMRVDSMTNEEVRQLNAKMDQLPAGGIIGTLGFILVILLITDLIGVTNVYSF